MTADRELLEAARTLIECHYLPTTERAATLAHFDRLTARLAQPEPDAGVVTGDMVCAALDAFRAPDGDLKNGLVLDRPHSPISFQGQLRRMRAAIEAALRSRSTGASFQERVQEWLLACFGAEIAADRIERNHRFLEEALELVQACGCTASEAHQLVDYVYGRPIGDQRQEVGGVMNTLAALCLAHGFDMNECAEAEMARVWTLVEKIRAKQAAKPKHSPLPEHVRSTGATVGVPDDSAIRRLAWKLWQEDQPGIIWSGDNRAHYRARAAALLSAAPPAPAPVAVGEDWKPIATAPKDGQRLLLWSRGPTWADFYVGYYDEGDKYSDAPVGWFTDEGADIDPRYWRPLPPPPQDEEKGR